MKKPIVLKIRSGCAGGGKGALWCVDKTFTLSTIQDMTIFYEQSLDEVGNSSLPERTGSREKVHRTEFGGGRT